MIRGKDIGLGSKGHELGDSFMGEACKEVQVKY